jgi:SPX domain protein involved in polyphosphate accumulation
MIPVEGHANLFRDENTNAIINCDDYEYNQYMKMKNEKRRQRAEIDQLKNDVSEIKSMLRELLNGSKRN